MTHAFKMLTDPEYQYEEAKRRKPERDLHIRMTVPVKFEDGFFGRTFNINYNRVKVGEDGKPIEAQSDQVIETIQVSLLAGFIGDTQVFEGKGLIQGDISGDCYVDFQFLPHNLFKMAGNEVFHTASIPMDLMLKGGDLEVPTMYGLKTLHIPPGSQPDDRVSVGKYGIGKEHDHYVVLDPVFPSKEDLKQKDSWKGLNIEWGEEATTDQSVEDEELDALFANLMKNQKFADLYNRRFK